MASAPSHGPLLQIGGVSRRFGKVVALAEVGLTVGAGEVVGLLGPNGAGKTTLLRIAAGLLRADEGHVLIGGRPQGLHACALRREVGFVSVDLPPFPEFSPREMLDFTLAMHGHPRRERRERVRQALSAYRLDGFAGKKAAALSTGMRQRLRIACALAHAPALVLLDEPTGGLDPEAQREFRELFRAATGGGRGVLISTHDLPEAADLCQRILFLREGRMASEVSRGVSGEWPEDLWSLYHKTFRAPLEASG